MAKRRTTNVEGYYRKGHRTSAHVRHLNDSGMMLELAEGRTTVSVSQYPCYIMVPDPRNVEDPIYVREEMLYNFLPVQREQLFKFAKNWNSSKDIAKMREKLNGMDRMLKEGEVDSESSDVDWDEVVSIVGTVVSWFDSGSSGGGSGSGNTDPGTIVSSNGLVAVMRGNIGFGINPQARQIIAFSSPQNFLAVFPNLPPGMGSTIPWLPMPPQVPGEMINYALNHPDQIIRQKSGGGYEVVPGSYVSGHDPNGNPTIYPPVGNTPPPSSSGGGISSLIGVGSFIAVAGSLLKE